MYDYEPLSDLFLWGAIVLLLIQSLGYIGMLYLRRPS